MIHTTAISLLNWQRDTAQRHHACEGCCSSGSTGYSLTTGSCPKATARCCQGPEEPASEGNAPGAGVGYFWDLRSSRGKKEKVKYNVLYEKETKTKQFNHPAITWMNKNQHVREHVFEVKHSQKIQRQHNLKDIWTFLCLIFSLRFEKRQTLINDATN